MDDRGADVGVAENSMGSQLDAFKGHLTDSVKNQLRKINTELVMPGEITSVLQPMDVSINKPFTDRLRQQYLTWISDPALSYKKLEKSNAQLLQKSHGGCWLHGKPSQRALSSDLSRSVA